MSTQEIYTAVIAAAKKRLPALADGEHLDIGAGRGELISELGRTMKLRSSACDYHVERFALPHVEIRQVNLNAAPLPYPDGRFALVTASEVIEHLENFRALLREAYRVTAKNGLVVLTTPNVLNAGSRGRYVVSGFANLFGPLPLRNDKLYSTGGHISMIPYFYLAHALREAGFEDVELSIDKKQRKSMLWLILLAPLIFALRARFYSRERDRYKTLTEHNEPYVAAHFSMEMLLGRTIVVSAVKK